MWLFICCAAIVFAWWYSLCAAVHFGAGVTMIYATRCKGFRNIEPPTTIPTPTPPEIRALTYATLFWPWASSAVDIAFGLSDDEKTS